MTKFARNVLITLLATAATVGCTATPPAASAPPSMATGDVMALQPSNRATAGAIIADVGAGQITPAALSFRVNLGTLSTKASTPGSAAKTVTDLTHIRFYLIESTTGTAPTALAGSGFTYAVTATNRTNNRIDVTFTNVPANTATKSYYIATAGFASATTIAANNITNSAAPFADATEGQYYVSNSGGDVVNPGCVAVATTTYALSGTAALGVPLKLLNAVTPTLDSDINVTAGDEITGAGSGSAS